MGSVNRNKLEQVDVVVVGAGWNGLIGAKTYLDFAPDANLVLLDDQATIGGVWSTERIYPNLFAQIRHGQFEYSFYPMRNEGITADGFISGETIHNYLNDFAKDYDLVRRTKLQHQVERVERDAAGGWRLDIKGRDPIKTKKLIYASGATSHPVIPTFRQTNFRTPIIHSSDVGTNLDSLNGITRATIVGSAKSAYDTVYMLLKAGVQVDWIIREDGSGPLAMMPPYMFGYFHTMDLVANNFMALFGSSIMRTKGIGYQIFNKTVIGRAIARTFWRALTMIAGSHAGYDNSPNAQKLKPLPVGTGTFWANAGLGAASAPNYWQVFHDGDCTVHKSEIKMLTEGNLVTLLNGTKFQTDYIILCTGFDKSYHQFSPELQQELGLVPDPGAKEQTKWAKLEADAELVVDELLPVLKNSPFAASPEQPHFSEQDPSPRGNIREMHGPSRHYRRLVVPRFAAQGDRSVYFPGFIHTIYTPLVSEVQALWGVAFMRGLLDDSTLPSQREMEREVAEWNVWTRKRYGAQGRKHAYAIYDFLSYIDVLLEDLGVETARKSNALAELVMPKYPRDYKGIQDEFKLKLAARAGNASALKKML